MVAVRRFSNANIISVTDSLRVDCDAITAAVELYGDDLTQRGSQLL